MAQNDLIQKTRFEKQIPFPILAEIAAEVKMSEEQFPDEGTDFTIQRECMHEIIHALEEIEYESAGRKIKLLNELIAEAIRTIKLIKD